MIDYKKEGSKEKGKLVLHCWDICAMQGVYLSQDHMHQADLLHLRKMRRDHGWVADVQSILRKSYEVLILTDKERRIQWVNAAFQSMTGYPSAYAIGKTPDFLQGENTTPQSKMSIGENLAARKIFTERIVNYRKSGEEYLCRLQVYPLHTSSGELVHFLALESEVVSLR